MPKNGRNPRGQGKTRDFIDKYVNNAKEIGKSAATSKSFPDFNSGDSKGFVEDFGNLFQTGNSSDLTIICGEKSFNCHKAILVARSDVFSAMFEMTESSENQTGRIKIEDFSPKTVETLLIFIYGNKV
jgi:hypothetical protein